MSPPPPHTRPPLRPAQWLICSPLVILPLLAAMFIEQMVEGRVGKGFSLANYSLLVQHHWFWLVVTLGLGCWVGWYTAIDRALPKDAEEKTEAP